MGDRDEARGAVPVWPDMRIPFALFCDAPWQWVSLGVGGVFRANISRTELEASARSLGVTMTPDIFADVRTMEEEAITFWARKR
jgi:hypothetical protein